MNAKDFSDIRRKLCIVEYGREIGNVSKPAGTLGISKRSLLQAETRLRAEKKPSSTPSLVLRIPGSEFPARREERIVHLRINYLT